MALSPESFPSMLLAHWLQGVHGYTGYMHFFFVIVDPLFFCFSPPPPLRKHCLV